MIGGMKCEREIMEWVISIVVGLLVVIVVTKFIGESYTVSGSSNASNVSRSQ